ncbi:hypothetical protein PR048_023596 [Dryococelus australis]|uniref:Uncharacterized protein n=1 Tax=Dryococelus australis TaxID=614101 RepID=A0ABQ9GUK0_9NEOP|nr:hypothetical protein PR048_023596 [Dryococelus australis]
MVQNVWWTQVVRVLRGQGDQWDNRARARGVTASFSLNGIGLVPEETADLFQENEELKVADTAVVSVHVHCLAEDGTKQVRCIQIASVLCQGPRCAPGDRLRFLP